MTTSLSDLLQQTIQDWKVREEADEQSRLEKQDVETAKQLQERLEQHLQMTQLQKQLLEFQMAWQEHSAVEADKKAKISMFADQLAKEMDATSEELKQMEILQTKHDRLLQEHDEVVAKLLQAQEDLQDLKERGVRPAPSEEEEAEAVVEEEDTVPAVELVEEEQGSTTEEAVPVEDPLPEEAIAPIEANEKSEDSPVPVPEPSPITQSESVTLVSLDVGEEAAPNLVDLDTEILLHLFAFLDALDILNVAQVNISMYSRVDSLFGMGQNEVDDSSTIATNPSVSVASKPSTAAATTAATTVTETTSASTTGPTMVSLPPAPAPAAAKPAAPEPVAAPPTPTSSNLPARRPPESPPRLATVGSNLLNSFLQPRRSPPRPSPVGSPSRRSEPQPMNAALANSMASKLSDAELNAIINMTERLKQKDIQLEQLEKERDELAASLDGTEGVKQFLIAKVRSMEQAMQSTEDNDRKTVQQIASDQEVIAFLDCRVQELERQVDRMEATQQTVQAELVKTKQQYEQKAAVMGDMLQFERDRFAESEREWKATKKILVKEVKHGRTQMATLQAERDGLREQNERLRANLLHHPRSSNGIF